MNQVSAVVLFLAIMYMYARVTIEPSVGLSVGPSNFNESVHLGLLAVSLATITIVLVIEFVSIFNDQLDESDEDDDDEFVLIDDGDEDEDIPKCKHCERSDRWIFSGDTMIHVDPIVVKVHHDCACDARDVNHGYITSKNRSFYLKMVPEFFDLSEGGTGLLEQYNDIKRFIEMIPLDYYCDHPGCGAHVSAIGRVFPEMHISLYLDGSCRIDQLDDGKTLIKRDFCNEHKADGGHTFVVCRWERVTINVADQTKTIMSYVNAKNDENNESEASGSDEDD